MQVGDLAAQHDDGAVAAVVAGVGKFEGVGARDLELAFLATPEPHARERYGVVEKLELVALAGGASGPHRALACLEAIGPKQCTADDDYQRQTLPHRRIMRS